MTAPGLAAIVYGMSEAGSHGTIANTSTIVGVVCGVALVAAFVFHALRMRGTPLVDVRLLANRGDDVLPGHRALRLDAVGAALLPDRSR